MGVAHILGIVFEGMGIPRADNRFGFGRKTAVENFFIFIRLPGLLLLVLPADEFEDELIDWELIQSEVEFEFLAIAAVHGVLLGGYALLALRVSTVWDDQRRKMSLVELLGTAKTNNVRIHYKLL